MSFCLSGGCRNSGDQLLFAQCLESILWISYTIIFNIQQQKPTRKAMFSKYLSIIHTIIIIVVVVAVKLIIIIIIQNLTTVHNTNGYVFFFYLCVVIVISSETAFIRISEIFI